MTAEVYTSRMCFVLTPLCCQASTSQCREHQADVLLDTDAQIQELRFQETVEAYPCHGKGGSGRNKDTQDWKILDMFLRARWKSR